MKILSILVLLMLLATASAVADEAEPVADFLAKGTRLVGGSFSFSSAGNTYHENGDGDRTQEWSLRPGGGYFVADQLALDLHLEGTWFVQGDVRSSHYGLGPVLEYYFDVVGDDEPQGHAVPYLALGYLWGQAREDGTDYETKFNSGMWTMSAGLSWMLSDVIATDLELNYRVGEFTEKVPVDGVKRDSDRVSFFLGIKAFIP